MQLTKNKKTGRFEYRFYDSKGIERERTSARYFPKGITTKEAEFIALALREKHEERISKTSDKSIVYCLDKHLEMVKHIGSEDDYKRAKSHIKRIKEFADGSESINDARIFANNYKLELIENEIAPSTINKRLTLIRQSISLAYNRGWIERNFKDDIKNEKVGVGRVRWLTVDEFERLVDCCEGDELKDIIIFRTMTGIRNKEFTRLTAQSLQGSRIIIDGKGGKKRSFQIDNEAIKAFVDINFENRMSYDVQRAGFIKAKLKAGLVDLTMHDLRHTFASWLAQDGNCSLHQLQQVMGHTNMNMTLKYAHLMPENLDGVANAFSIKCGKPPLKLV